MNTNIGFTLVLVCLSIISCAKPEEQTGDLANSGVARKREQASQWIISSKPSSQDTDGDGKVDTVNLDTNGDGKVDRIDKDTDGDGHIDEVLTDTNHDGTIDQRETDTNNDGKLDTKEVDSDHNGTFETSITDTDGDGTLDTISVDEDGDGVPEKTGVDIDNDGDIDIFTELCDIDKKPPMDTCTDTKHDDGSVTREIDLGSDGDIDVTAEINSEGHVTQQTQIVDANNDGIDDTIVYYDTDGEPGLDVAIVDLDSNGSPNGQMARCLDGAFDIDYDGDGVCDKDDLYPHDSTKTESTEIFNFPEPTPEPTPDVAAP